MRIAIVGGGPGGLFAATLLKRSDPSREVVVLERNRADDTFGFGVVFSDATLAGIHAADPVLLTALTEHGVHWDAIEVRVHGECHRCGGNGMAAVERKLLLHLLQEQARAAGVRICFSTEAHIGEVLDEGYDLVVAADGTNSGVRDRFADVFGPSVEIAAAKFIWLGTTYPFAGLTFVHERGPHGVFAVHGYPIGTGVSTFIVETDECSWRAAGLDEFDVAVPPGRSDEVSRAYLQHLFAEQIDGHPLLVNNSRWSNFRTRRAARWHHRVGGSAVALLGDAAHTAHFSVGSGTKMAMEDAIALSEAVSESPDDVDAAMVAYEAHRRPQVEKIQNSARPSLSWWEHFGRAHDMLPGWQFAYHFFTRSLTDRKLRKRAPEFVAASHAAWHTANGAAPLDTPLDIGAARTADRVASIDGDSITVAGRGMPLRHRPDPGSPWVLDVAAPDREEDLPEALDALASGAAAGATLAVVAGGAPLTRRLLCEQARLGHGVPAVLVEDLDEDAAVTAVLSGRTDLVAAPVGGGEGGNRR